MTSSYVSLNYVKAKRQADSVDSCKDEGCRLFPGTNDGYFIQAFGKQYRFASIECPQKIGQLFIDIVAHGPLVAK